VWEWQVQTGVYSTEVSTARLRALELDGLSLEDTVVRKAPEFTAAAKPQEVRAARAPAAKESFDRAKAGGGFNPYDNVAALAPASNPFRNVRPRESPTPTRSAVARSKPAPTAVRTRNGWLKLKRALTRKD
jgi:hypothetical protein